MVKKIWVVCAGVDPTREQDIGAVQGNMSDDVHQSTEPVIASGVCDDEDAGGMWWAC